MSLRVLQVIPYIAPRYGGPSKAVVELAAALYEQQVETVIATTDADGSGRLAVPAGQIVQRDGVPIIHFQRRWSEAFKYAPGLARWLRAHLADFQVVHIHDVFTYPSLAAAAACRQRGLPYLVRPLGTLDPWSLARRRLRKRLLWQLGVGRMLRQAAAIHYTTAEERRLAESSLPLRRGVVIPLGVARELLALPRTPDEQAPYVLVLSRLHPKKGLELLIGAFQDLLARPGFSAWRLVIAGDGDPAYVARLRALAAAGGADQRGQQITFTGWQSGAERTSLLRGASLLAQPSFQENFGLAVAEALAASVPVAVSASVNLAPEIASWQAGWVMPMERERISQTLTAALADPDERQRRGAAGRRLARARFDWASIARELRALYEALADGQPPTASSV